MISNIFRQLKKKSIKDLILRAISNEKKSLCFSLHQRQKTRLRLKLTTRDINIEGKTIKFNLNNCFTQFSVATEIE